MSDIVRQPLQKNGYSAGNLNHISQQQFFSSLCCFIIQKMTWFKMNHVFSSSIRKGSTSVQPSYARQANQTLLYLVFSIMILFCSHSWTTSESSSGLMIQMIRAANSTTTGNSDSALDVISKTIASFKLNIARTTFHGTSAPSDFDPSSQD